MTIYEKLRIESLNKYYKDPNICQNCKFIILIPENKKASEIKKKKFCNRNCYIAYRAKLSKPYKVPKKVVRAFIKHKLLNEAKKLVALEIEHENLRVCICCCEEYDIKKRAGRPGKITHCEECACEVDERYQGVWSPVGESTGRNLHQWGVTPFRATTNK